MTRIYKIRELPKETLIMKNMESVNYYDSYMIKKKTSDSIEIITKKILTLPSWIIFALRIRYYLIVRPLGLSTGRFDSGIENLKENDNPVPIIGKNENEIVMGSDDKHLYYRISIMKREIEQESEIYLNTIVKYNNIWGKLYFMPVKIGHKLVVKSLLSRLA
ncbi:MAG: DUF2867 domain-containing protein [Ignavibacteria bacterium]|nr:DUF2867 domain-containing protein [Ignavibacteria bacterium]